MTPHGLNAVKLAQDADADEPAKRPKLNSEQPAQKPQMAAWLQPPKQSKEEDTTQHAEWEVLCLALCSVSGDRSLIHVLSE